MKTEGLLKILLFAPLCMIFYSCNYGYNEKSPIQKDTVKLQMEIIYTPYSTDSNQYIGFNSQKAINTIAGIENDYFNRYREGVSKYYGTDWYESQIINAELDSTINTWNDYLSEMKDRNLKPDSFHCTIYAIKALEAGFGDEFERLETLHKKHYSKHEHAGWSLAYLLVKYYNWNAYLIINDISNEYNRCTRNFKTEKKYYVWRQPDIPLTDMFDAWKDRDKILNLVNQHEFGWGFSNQGIHTWITRHDRVKECRWEGAPGKKYDHCDGCLYLFKEHYFMDYTDYFSHVVVFPPKKSSE